MISIIIPAYNEERYIENCLQSITKQHYENYEIIVVADACTDATKKIAKKYTRKVYTINTSNVSAARNNGAAKATGNILVFLDADSVIAPNLLQEIHTNVRSAGFVGGTTRTLSLEHLWKAKILWAFAHYARLCFFSLLPTASGLIFCRKDAFPLYDETRKLAEDTHFLLDLKKKGTLAYVSGSFIKTSSRRLEEQGYITTLFKQYKAFFLRDKDGY